MASPPLLDLPPLPPSANSGSLTPLTGALQVRGAGTVVATDAGVGGGSPAAGTDSAGAGDARTPYSGGGAGGKVRSSRRVSLARSKKTPYARPASGRHATPGGTAAAAAASSSSSIALRLVDSASRLISSSATYLFSSFFGRRSPLAIANGDALPADVSAAEEEAEEDLIEAPVDQAEKYDTSSDQALILVGDSVGTEKRVMDMVQVEQILKQQTWSREQVNRLTEILQTRVLENSVHKKSEAQRWREDLKKARNDATPIEVARAYMGERTARPSGLATSIQESVHQTDRVADLQPPPGLGLIEDRYRASPVVRTWARSSGPVRTPKRSSALDDEWASVGPIRRTRQKSLMLANSSPYARGLTGSSLPPRAFTSPPIQSSQTARKILETLEKLTPSPKGKSLEGELKVATEGLPPELATDVSKLPERKSLQISEVSRLPKMTEPGPSSGKLTLEPSATDDFQALDKRVTHRTAPFIVGSPTFIPERSKGFRMSAVFEESNSDEEIRLNAKIKLPTTSEAQLPSILSETREAPQLSSLSSVKLSSAAVATIAPATASTDISVSSTKTLPPAQTNVSPISTLTFSTTIQPTSLPAVESSGPAATSSSLSFAFGGQSGISSSGQFFPTGPMPTSSKANPFSVGNGDANIASDAVVISATSSSTTAVSPAVPASSASPVAGPPFAGDTLLASAAASTGVSLDTATAIEDLSEGENGTVMATEGPGADKVADADIMAADPMAEEPDSFAMSSSPPAFTFGSSSAATSTTKMPAFTFGSSSAVTSTSSLPAFPFGASISSPSTFSFAVQSSGTATPTSSSTSFAFGGQSGTSSSGSVFAFGAPSTPLPASPFSLSRTGNSAPSFTFGSSSAASSSAPPAFQTTSSALPSFSISSSAAPTFSFGAHAASSPVSSSSSAVQMFGFGASSTANLFSTAGAANSSPAFTFASSPAPVSSAAPTFSFGGGAGTSASTGSSFAGQPFAFGAQQSPAASPFSPAGTPSSAPAFQFVSSSAASEMPSLSFGSTAASSPSPTFAFGAQSVVSPASSTPFMFGGQTGASPGVQPFPFGGQPTGTAQNPFSSPGASNTFSQPPGLEFAGGFALGATGGEKSGRKYFKAKRRK